MDVPKTEIERRALNEYLMAVVNNSWTCAHCIHNHGICYFAFDCIQNDFANMRHEKKKGNKNNDKCRF